MAIFPEARSGDGKPLQYTYTALNQHELYTNEQALTQAVAVKVGEDA